MRYKIKITHNKGRWKEKLQTSRCNNLKSNNEKNYQKSIVREEKPSKPELA